MGVNGEIGLRLPDVEWAVRSNAGALEGVTWVDYRLDPDLPVNRVVGHESDAKFRGYAYLGLLPTYIAEDTLAAQSRGRPTAWEALTLVFAQAGWTVASRSHLWAPYSPYPGVLAKMVEAFGVERAVHKFDRERLSRLAAMLPSWYPSRGRLDAAHEVLAACGLADEADAAFGQDDAPSESLKDEVLCCHSGTWWRARQAEGAQPAYRIHDGFVRFQPAEGEGFPLRKEDVLVAIPETGKVSLALHRLLPAWSAIRITTNEGPEPGAVKAEPAAKAPAAPATPAKAATPAAKTEAKTEAKAAKAAPAAPAAPAAKPAAPAAPVEKPAKPSLVATTVVPAEELEDDEGTQDALVPEDEELPEEIELGDADEVLDLEELDLLEMEPEPDEDPPTDPGSTKTEKPTSRREKAQKSNKSKDEK